MSTNFYLRLHDTPVDEDGLHIGLRTSYGRFLFQAHPHLGLSSFEDWKRKFPDGRIVCEYQETWAPGAFVNMVDVKQANATTLHWWEEPGACTRSDYSRYTDPAGYSFDKRNFS